MLARKYQIYSFGGSNRIYLTHFGRYGSARPYTFSILNKEKCNLQIATSLASSNQEQIKVVELTITNVFGTTYIMPTSETLDIDLTDIISTIALGTYEVIVRVGDGGTFSSSYVFMISVSYGYDYMRIGKMLDNCEKQQRFAINATTGLRTFGFYALPQEPILPYTKDLERVFSSFSYLPIQVWGPYGANNIDIYQNNVNITSFQGSSDVTYVTLSSARPYMNWFLLAAGTLHQTAVPRPISEKGIYLQGTMPYQGYQSSSGFKTKNKFGFFFDIFEIGNEITQTNLMPDATAMPYLLQNEMRIKVGIRNITQFDYIIYSSFFLCEDLKVVFDDMGSGTHEGYNARIVSRDINVGGSERMDFIIDLIISY